MRSVGRPLHFLTQLRNCALSRFALLPHAGIQSLPLLGKAANHRGAQIGQRRALFGETAFHGRVQLHLHLFQSCNLGFCLGHAFLDIHIASGAPFALLWRSRIGLVLTLDRLEPEMFPNIR